MLFHERVGYGRDRRIVLGTLDGGDERGQCLGLK